MGRWGSRSKSVPAWHLVQLAADRWELFRARANTFTNSPAAMVPITTLDLPIFHGPAFSEINQAAAIRRAILTPIRALALLHAA